MCLEKWVGIKLALERDKNHFRHANNVREDIGSSVCALRLVWISACLEQRQGEHRGNAD